MTGRNFFSGSTVHHWKSGSWDIITQNVKAVSEEKITCLFSLPTGAVKGVWDIIVKNPDGKIVSGKCQNSCLSLSKVVPPEVINKFVLSVGRGTICDL